MIKLVKVGTVPGKIQEVSVETGTIVKAAIETAGFVTEGYEVKVDGRTVDATTATVKSSTATILLVAKVKGNSAIVVKVGTVPGKIQEVTLDSSQSVGEAIQLAGLVSEGYEVKLNGRTANDSTRLGASAQTILLVAKVKGNL